ncbi:MAG: cryptochrome/photolyase family protein, partial [Acidobacteriota bacterium]
MPTAKNKELKSVVLVFPHQLFRSHPAIRGQSRAFIIEESLFFSQYRFHKQKLRFHRASMR